MSKRIVVNKPELSTKGILTTPEAKDAKVGDIVIGNGEHYKRVDARKNHGDAWVILPNKS